MLFFKSSAGESAERHLRPSGSMMMMFKMMMMMMMMMVVAADVEGVEEEESQKILEDVEADSMEIMEPWGVSPEQSWLVFRRNSDKGDNNNRRSKSSRRSSRLRLPGPQGPPGPSSQHKTQELDEELQEKLRGGWTDAPRVAVFFLGVVPQAVVVARRSLVELQTFSQVAQNRLQRGRGFNHSTGRFFAPVSGFYLLTASLLIECGDRQQLRVRDSVRASVCIESLCQMNLSVQSVLAASGGTSSVLLTGALYLQAGEYVSIFVDNSAGSSISVLSGSSFSGILLGV